MKIGERPKCSECGMNHYPDEKCRCNGWAPGDYNRVCTVCEEPFTGDKRAWQCHSCAHKIETVEAPVKDVDTSKLCIECAHHSRGRGFPGHRPDLCHRHQTKGAPSLIDGTFESLGPAEACHDERYGDGGCGTEGTYWEKKK